MLADFAVARGYGDLKIGVAEAVVEVLAPIRGRYRELIEDPAELDRLMARGAHRAEERAEAKLTLIKERMGF